MPFDSNQLRPIFGEIEDSCRGFLYTSFDDTALISASGYFTNAAGHNIQEGDFIFLQDAGAETSGAKYELHVVTGVSGGGAATVVFLTGVYSHSGQQLHDMLRIIAAIRVLDAPED